MKRRMSITIDETVYNNVCELAKKENRNVSNMIELLIKGILEA
jgi:predicted CopG family antitoxin